MFDQLVFFGDREQTRVAEASRALMLPAAALTLVASAGLLRRGRRWHALLAALPALVAVPLALVTPDAGFQLLAYVTAPASLVARLLAAVPRRPDRGGLSRRPLESA